ncbi:GNAT family N-acetyltransferase [Aquibacillus rhizosphaerae]|uniref:GNAT family N-acetyltransferase n=1 Tax=Aquibacillus rhizosphaerae TaxID=3051431 RepID=A0ABT7L8Y1_9BACI|nr:GNAT family N-acetyltransferase [Aquibacillus sp. LR5S19]MDL4842327.1 GNAT family N-acetyltransferase [Aquibacillus sp. LR5S19]
MKIIDVNVDNVDKYGFFCMRSKPKSNGYQNKLKWLKKRFQEGLRVKIIEEDGRQKGFIEYIPGKSTWRAINAKEYMVIHCFWVVGKNKEKGFGSKLLQECIQEAKKLNLSGVVIVTSDKGWLPSRMFFEKKEFNLVDKIGVFELMALNFKDESLPSFYDWQETAKEYCKGITVFKSDQCPFTQDALINLKLAADECDMEVNVIELDNYERAQKISPTPFGVFTVILDGEIITYHPETKNKFVQLLKSQKFNIKS